MAGAGQPDTCFDGTDEIFWHPIWVVLRMPKQSITSAEKENAAAKCIGSAVWTGRLDNRSLVSLLAVVLGVTHSKRSVPLATSPVEVGSGGSLRGTRLGCKVCWLLLTPLWECSLQRP